MEFAVVGAKDVGSHEVAGLSRACWMDGRTDEQMNECQNAF